MNAEIDVAPLLREKSAAPTVRRHAADLETAIADALQMADITVELLGRAFGFDKAIAPSLTAQEADLLMWSVLDVATRLKLVSRIFHGEELEGSANGR